ncbi:hypothetical protein Y1Q_0009034 [Alligator mississippiensis]|uniref:Uncharacterized protein n=1 Tax=Alligator mississippiensis TaxID=8496 RepID=A0A151P4W9_ALLMI|nr:hypothetical protein Y1Q_0009034 [Alligator mississippiensis]
MAKLLPPLPFALTPEGSCCILPLASHQHSADKPIAENDGRFLGVCICAASNISPLQTGGEALCRTELDLLQDGNLAMTRHRSTGAEGETSSQLLPLRIGTGLFPFQGLGCRGL